MLQLKPLSIKSFFDAQVGGQPRCGKAKWNWALGNRAANRPRPAAAPLALSSRGRSFLTKHAHPTDPSPPHIKKVRAAFNGNYYSTRPPVATLLYVLNRIMIR